MDDGLIIGLAILFSILTLALICFIISLYHYKKKTKHYHNVVHWYQNVRPSKVRESDVVRSVILGTVQGNQQTSPPADLPAGGPVGGGGWNLGNTTHTPAPG